MDAVEFATKVSGGTSAPSSSGFNELGMRVWTVDELKVVRELGERAKPFSISTALGR